LFVEERRGEEATTLKEILSRPLEWHLTNNRGVAVLESIFFVISESLIKSTVVVIKQMLV